MEGPGEDRQYCLTGVPSDSDFTVLCFAVAEIYYLLTYLSECIRGSFKSPNECPNIFVVAVESESDYIHGELFEYPNVFEYSLRSSKATVF